MTSKPTTDVAFSATVKAIQTRKGSRSHYAKVEQRGGWESRITPEIAAFIAERDSFYLGTASADGQPYIQHRGGPRGFLRVVDEHTLAFAEVAGNRQYITQGNLAENDRAYLFLMDYAHRRRLKIWGRARWVEDDPERPEIVFTVEAWDRNCPQNIPQLVPAADVAAEIAKLRARVAELESENRALRA